MIGIETLWDSLLLDSCLSLTSDFHNLFVVAKESPAHVSSFNSKLFLSALIKDTTLSRPLAGVLANMWLRAHGFSSSLSVSLESYLTTVKELDLQTYFMTELRSLPDFIYKAVLERIVGVICEDTDLLTLVPCVLQVELLKCKVGVSQGSILVPCLEHATQHFHLLDLGTTNKLTLLTFDIAFLVCYTGTATLITATSGLCEVQEELLSRTRNKDSPTADFLPDSHDNIPPHDATLSQLHEMKKATCCQFESSYNTSSRFQHLYPSYEAGTAFLDTISVHAISQHQHHLLATMYSLGRYLLSDQLSRALYSPSHVRYIEELVESVPEQLVAEVKTYPIYKTYNFDPDEAGWEELVIQVRNNLSKSAKSFEVMMRNPALEEAKIEDCIGLVEQLKHPQLAALFSRTFSNNHPRIPAQQQIKIIQRFVKLFSSSTPKFLSAFCKTLYNDQAFCYVELDQLREDSRAELLGDGRNITRTINQLGSKAPGKLRDKLYHILLINFALLPDILLRNVVSQATRNKALVGPVSGFLKEFLPFTLKPACTVSGVVFASLKTEFEFINTIKEIKQFYMFVDSLKPNLTHEAVLKRVVLPYLKCPQFQLYSTLTLLQFYLQQSPFYNFSVFYEVVRIWSAPDLDESCLKVLDDGGILDIMIDKMMTFPKEADLLFKLIMRGWGWRTGLRFLSISEEAKISFPRFWSGVDVSRCIAHNSLVFLKDDVTFASDDVTKSLGYAALQVARLTKQAEFHLADLDTALFTDDLFQEFGKLVLRSEREWENISCFVSSCFEQEFISIGGGVNMELSVTGPRDIVLETLDNIDIESSGYVCNDFPTFVMLSAVAGNFEVLNWFGKFCGKATNDNETAEPVNVTTQLQPADVTSQPADVTYRDHEKSSQELTKHFIRSCVLLHFIKNSRSLETLIMSLWSGVDVKNTDVGKVLALLPEQLSKTLSHKSKQKGCDTNTVSQCDTNTVSHSLSTQDKGC